MTKSILKTIYLFIICSFCLVRTAALAQETEEVRSDHMTQGITGALVEADSMQQRVLKYYEDKYGYNSVETLSYIEALAWMNMELQQFKDAEHYYLRAIKIREDKMQPSAANSQELAVSYFPAKYSIKLDTPSFWVFHAAAFAKNINTIFYAF